MFANNLSLKNTILVNTPLPTYKHLSPGSWKVPRLEEAFVPHSSSFAQINASPILHPSDPALGR